MHAPGKLGLPRFLPLQLVVHALEFGGLEALDLVAHAGGGLEVEIGGGIAHLLFECFQMGGEIAADLLILLGAPGDQGEGEGERGAGV